MCGGTSWGYLGGVVFKTYVYINKMRQYFREMHSEKVTPVIDLFDKLNIHIISFIKECIEMVANWNEVVIKQFLALCCFPVQTDTFYYSCPRNYIQITCNILFKCYFQRLKKSVFNIKQTFWSSISSSSKNHGIAS